MSLHHLASSSDDEAPKSRRSLAWLLPLGLLVGFIGLVLLLFGERLIPAVAVQAAPSQTIRLGPDGGSGAPGAKPQLIFQASGWIEPDPYIIYASVLISGVVDEVHVLEGELVEKGELLATLVDDDAELLVAQRQRELEVLRRQMEVARADLELIAARIEAQRQEVAAARAEEENASDRLDRFLALDKGVASERDLVRTRSEYLRQSADRAGAEARIVGLQAERKKIRLDLKTREADIDRAENLLDQAKLQLERTRIVAPMDGRIQTLHAAPGKKRMLPMDDPHSAEIAEIYDPEKLQARIDVPLSEAAALQIGQKVELRSDLLPDLTLEGEVTRITGEADLQRNTLQAKVAIQEPDPRLRPEMLVRAKFFSVPGGRDAAPEAAGGDGGGNSRYAVYVPEEAVADGPSVWVASPENTAERRPVELGDDIREGHRRVIDGLRSGEKVILPPHDGLSPGARIEIQNL